MAKRIILVTGVPGSGKSTALDGLSDGIAGSSVVSMGTELLKRSGAEDRDLLRKGDDADQLATRLRSEILRELVDSDDDVVIIDTHAIVKTTGGYIQGFTDSDLDILRGKVVAVVCVHADPAEIKRRRDADDGRHRDSETEVDIGLQQDASESTSARIAGSLGAALYTIDTSSTTKEEAQALMAETIRKALSSAARRNTAVTQSRSPISTAT